MKILKIILSAILISGLTLFHSCKNNNGKENHLNVTKISSEKAKYKKINEKLLVSSWFDTSQAKLHITLGYHGIAKSDNMATLLYKKWRLEGNNIIFTIESIGNGTTTSGEETYEIIKVDNHELILKQGKYVSKYLRKHPTANIKKGQKITSPLTVKVNSEGVWFASEGELGTVKIVDENYKILNLKDEWGILMSVDGNWMHTKPALFETTIPFDVKNAKKGKIIIYNNTGQGEGKEAGVSFSFEIPITF